MQSKNTGKQYKIEDVSIKGNRAIIKINSKKYYLSLDEFDSLKLRESDIIYESFLDELKKRSDFEELYFYGEKLLTKERYSSFQIKRKLWKKGASLEDSQIIVSRLNKAGLIDDYRYAVNYANDIGPYKGLGKNKIIYNLTKVGISQDIISSLEFDESKEIKTAIGVVEKLNAKLSKNPDKKKKNKIISSLISDGFSYEVARKAITYITPNDKAIMRKQLKVDFDSTYRKLSKQSYGKELKRKICRNLMNKGYEFEEILDLLKEEGLYEDD